MTTKKRKLKKKEKCKDCNSSQIYFRKDKSYFCRHCGFDSRGK